MAYGAGLEERVREAAPEGIAAALDCVGTDEAVDVSLAMVPERARIVTIAAKQRGADVGIRVSAETFPRARPTATGSAQTSCGWPPREVSRSRWHAPIRSSEHWTRPGSSAAGIRAARWHSSPRTPARRAPPLLDRDRLPRTYVGVRQPASPRRRLSTAGIDRSGSCPHGKRLVERAPFVAFGGAVSSPTVHALTAPLCVKTRLGDRA